MPTLPTRSPRNCRQPRQAQATVEFAIVALFVLFPMVFGMIELGRGIWYYNQLSHISREGARWLVVTHHDPATSTFLQNGNSPTVDVTYTDVATCCPATTAAGWIAQMDVGIPTDQLTVRIRRSDSLTGATWTQLGYVHGRNVLVRVTYPYQPVVTTMLGITAPITMSASTVMKME